MDSSIFEFGQVHHCKQGLSQKQELDGKNPDEMAHDESSHLDLHCLHRYVFWSARLKWLTHLLQTEKGRKK